MESCHCVATPFVVITGLDPVIHALLTSRSDKNVDGRVKPGHDEDTAERSHSPYEGQPSKPPASPATAKNRGGRR